MDRNHESLNTAEVLENRNLGSDYFELVFRLPKAASVPEPGQFLTLRCGEGTSPLLRRPFAQASYRDNAASVIIEKRGSGTAWLAQRRPGDTLSVLGPLGRGFTLPSRGPVYLAAGGIGLGPMLYTRSVIKELNLQVILAAGFRDKSRIISALPETDDILICTDDGSRGFAGTVTAGLESLPGGLVPGATLLACGPHPMLKACHELAMRYNLRCQVSMEEIMACGMGACAGCVIPGREQGTYLRVCKDGPVFDSGELAWT